MRGTPLLLAALLLAPAAVVQADASIDLSGPMPAGDFRAWRVTLTAPGTIELGADFPNIASAQPVLPLLQVVMKDGAVFDAGAIFMYDAVAQATALVRAGGLEQRVGTFTIQGGALTTYNAGAGSYLLVLATGPGDGDTQVTMRVNAPATLDAAQAGRAFFARGVDLSATASDVFAHGGNGYVRAWAYDGVDVPFEVAGRAFGYVGYHTGTQAHWADPQGQTVRSFLTDGAPGAWAARFPQEQFLGPVCLGPCFLPGFDTREDPPFAVGADVTL